MLGLAALALAGCGAPATITSSSYLTSCSVPADCAPVFFGSVCGCGCANGALNKTDLARYQADYEAARAGCSGSVCFADCISTSATCTAGVCTLVR
jgi:hypothetical protein